ncbi:MAG TPA: hypothetical protein EYP79_02715 [Campylobacterales bacterium]|nr:hypothetical protein [Campylobacterales bacterium]
MISIAQHAKPYVNAHNEFDLPQFTILSTVVKATGNPPLAINEKNLAFHLFFQSLTKTLRDKEIRPYLNKIIQVLEKRFGAQIRA